MMLGNKRNTGVCGLMMFCLHLNCRHHEWLGVDGHADEVPVP